MEKAIRDRITLNLERDVIDSILKLRTEREYQRMSISRIANALIKEGLAAIKAKRRAPHDTHE